MSKMKSMQLIKTHIHLLILIALLFVSFAFRIWNLSNTPNGFHADEASFYINSLSILTTGADEDGTKLPISLSSFIDPKPALFSYFQIPFIALVSDPIFAARLPSIFLSLLSLITVFLLVSKLSDRVTGVFVIAILAISPWHIIVSRGTQEVIASFLFLSSALLFLTLFFRTQKKQTFFELAGFALSTFLSMYFYHSAKVLLPLLIIGFVWYFQGFIRKNSKKTVIIILLAIFSIFASFFVQESNSRIAAVGILSDAAPMQQLTEQIYTANQQLPIPVMRVFYNKGQAYTTAFISEYLSYFSPSFLFLHGGKPQRYLVPDHGLVYLIEIPLIIAGLYIAIKNKRKELPLFLGVLFLSPIPAALTTLETPSIIRSFPIVLSLAYFSSLSLQSLLFSKNSVLKIVLLTGIFIIYSWQIAYFTIQYHVQAYFDDPWYRNTPYTDIAQSVKKMYPNYSEIRVTNDLRPLYSYFVIEKLITIEELQANPHARDLDEYRLGKFVFNRGVCELGDLKPGVLYIAETQCKERSEYAGKLKVIQKIRYHDEVEVYDLMQVSE